MILFILFFLIFAYTPRKNIRELSATDPVFMRVHKSQNMLCVPISGDPRESAQRCFGELFKAFYMLKKTYPSIAIKSPRARWNRIDPLDRTTWNGSYGIPLPSAISILPEEVSRRVPTVSIAVWTYDTLMELTTIGPYSGYFRALNRLEDFAAQSQFMLGELYEEEYLLGPTILTKGDQKKYATKIMVSLRHASSF